MELEKRDVRLEEYEPPTVETYAEEDILREFDFIGLSF